MIKNTAIQLLALVISVSGVTPSSDNEIDRMSSEYSEYIKEIIIVVIVDDLELDE